MKVLKIMALGLQEDLEPDVIFEDAVDIDYRNNGKTVISDGKSTVVIMDGTVAAFAVVPEED